MSFLQPLMLAALPLIGLPILIHLINQRRYQTTHWAAMMFLLAANRMSRGYARLRQWLILLVRTLAVAALIFAVGRPLASGWLGLTAGGRADTTIILLDRSPSMHERGHGAAQSKLQSGRQQLAQTLTTLGSSRWVLIESTTNQPRSLQSPDVLLDLPCTEPASAQADLTAMLEAARDYIQANRTGRTEIWICSDLRENDWRPDSGRWHSLRESFLQLPQGVRFHLLAYPDVVSRNVAVRVTGVRRQQSDQHAELLVSLHLAREHDADDKLSVPLQFEIQGARSEVTVEMTGPQHELRDYRIPVEGDHQRGWGRVSIPADANPADNQCYFVFDEPPVRKTIIVADRPEAAWPLELAATIPPDPTVHCAAEIVAIEQLASVPWEQVSLLVWQAPLPQGDEAGLVQSFVERGGQVVFLPPHAPGTEELFGLRWASWVDQSDQLAIQSWRGDQGLLANTQSGQALPVGDLQVKRYCGISGESTPLAHLRDGTPVIARATTDQGGVYFCATTPAPADYYLALDGVVLYVALQRAIASGAAVLGNTQNLVAGPPPPGIPESWQRLSGAETPLSTEYPFHQGVYATGERLLAVNRPAAEDQAAVLADARVTGLFRGLQFTRVDDLAGSARSLVQEIWRLFLAAMIVALVCEAALCLPRLRRREGAAT